MNDLERRQRRLDRARFWIQTELSIGVALTFLTWFLSIAAPGYMGAMFGYHEPSVLERLYPLIVVVGPIVGLAAMSRLSRPRVEAGERDWRYRDF